MEPNQKTCPICHTTVDPTDIFCSACGTNIQTNESSLTSAKKIYVLAITLLLPPFGLIYAFKYIKSPDERIRKFGWIIIALTIASIIVSVIIIATILNEVNSQLNQLPTDIDLYQGF